MARVSSGPESKQSVSTPRWLFDVIAGHIPFGIDLAASKANTLLPLFISEQENSLVADWAALTSKDSFGWCNPPYRDCSAWMHKAKVEVQKGASVVCLQPAALHRVYYNRTAKVSTCATVILNTALVFEGYGGMASPTLHALFVWNRGVSGLYQMDPKDPDEVAYVLGGLREKFV